MEEIEIEIPTDGIKEGKIDAFKDLITRYLVENDKYNDQAIYDGIFPAISAMAKNKNIKEILKAINPEISGFQLNWVINTLGEYATRGSEIKEIWDKYQKSMEPKKKPRKSRPEEECLED